MVMLVLLGCIFLLVLTAVFFSEEIGDIIGDIMDNRHERKMQLLKIKELELKQQKVSVPKTEPAPPKNNSMLFDEAYFREINPNTTLCKCGNCGDTIACKRHIDGYYNSAMKVLTGLYKWHIVNGKPICAECWKEYRKTLKKSYNSPVDDTTVKQEF